MKNYLLLSILLLIASLNFNIILKSLGLVTGGTQGVALLINRLIDLSPSFIILFININTLILCYFLLDRKVTYSSFLSSFIYPIMVKITSSLSFSISNIFISSIIAGIVCGLTNGYIYRLGFSSGGVSTINLIINKYLKIRIALVNFIINFIIIILGCFIFGIKKGFYSTIVIVISSLIIDIIVKNKQKKLLDKLITFLSI